jgi:hypothetical protein
VTEAELKAKAKALAELLATVDGLENVEFIDEGDLEGEPASICVEHDGTALALGVLPL